MRHRWMRHSGRWLALLLLALVSVGVGAVLFATPARADGVTVTLSIANGTNFTYGGTQPSFTVVVTFSTPPTTSNCGQVNVQLDNGQDSAANPQPVRSSDGLTWTYTRIMPSDTIPVGQRTAVATFFAPGISCVPVQSSPFNFTVNKATFGLTCSIDTTNAYLGGNGQTLHILMAPYSGAGVLPTELQTGSYNVSLDGPTHVAAANLTLDSNNEATMIGPSQIGLYTITCTFNGSTSYTQSTITDPNPYLFSALHKLGVVNIYTNPTTLVAGRSADFYVAFHPASGWPMPTGEFSIWLGQSHTMFITLGSTGDYLIHVQTIPELADVSHVEIYYSGDVNYAPTSVLFPLTNPSIPSGTNAGGSGNGSLGTGNKPQGTAVATATAGSEETTPTTVGVGRAVPATTTTPSSGIGGGVILAVILATLVLLAVAGAGVAIYLLRRRANIAAPGATQLQDGWPGAPANQWDAPGRGYPPDQRYTRGQGQWDDATQPYRRRDR